MKLDQTFTVDAPPDVVWRALTDVMRVAPNLPGANITEDAGDGTFKGEFKVKIGPTTAAYNGAMKIESLDDSERVATMSARGTDKRGNGGASATIVSRVGADPDGRGTRVDVETDFSITGKLARFGRGGMIQDVSNRLLREFAANLQADLAGDGGAAPAGAGAPGTQEPPSQAAAAATGPAAEAAGKAAASVAEASGADSSGQTAPEALKGDTPHGTTGDAPQGTTGDAPGGAGSSERPRAPRPPAEPLDGGGLVLGVLKERLEGTLPAFLLGVVVGLLAARRKG